MILHYKYSVVKRYVRDDIRYYKRDSVNAWARSVIKLYMTCLLIHCMCLKDSCGGGGALFFIADLVFSSVLYVEIKNEPVKQGKI